MPKHSPVPVTAEASPAETAALVAAGLGAASTEDCVIIPASLWSATMDRIAWLENRVKNI